MKSKIDSSRERYCSALLGAAVTLTFSDLTDAEIRAISRHKSPKVLPRYAKRTMKQVMEGARKRRAMRTKADNLSE